VQSFLYRLNAALSSTRPGVTVAGIAWGFAFAIAAAFLLDGFRAHSCPPGPFIYGSMDFGSIASIPWALVGMFACWATLDFASNYASIASAVTKGSRLVKADSSWLSRIFRRGFGASLVFAVLTALFGLLTGFCALDNGILPCAKHSI